MTKTRRYITVRQMVAEYRKDRLAAGVCATAAGRSTRNGRPA